MRMAVEWGELLEPSRAQGGQFAIVNLALGLAGGYPCTQDWQAADELVSTLRPETGVTIDEGLVSWWSELATAKGDVEGHLVIGLLVRHRIVEDPDGLSVAQRMDRAAGWNVPDWIKERR